MKISSLLWTILQSYLQLPLILLCIGGGLRRGGLLVWVYNAKAYFQKYYCDTLWVGVFLSWVPLVGGSVGAVLGGVVSDRLAKRWGRMTRPYVLIFSQVSERERERVRERDVMSFNSLSCWPPHFLSVFSTSLLPGPSSCCYQRTLLGRCGSECVMRQ